MEYDLYLVPRIAGIRRSMDAVPEAAHLGTVTVNPDVVPLGATPMDHAIEVINNHIPYFYSHED